MKLIIINLLTVFVLFSCVKDKGVVDEVNCLIGTDWHGHTYPGVSQPFGMVQLSPDTRNSGWDACAGYHYADSSLYGFSHTHLSGTGCADLADILVRPTIMNLDLENEYLVPKAKFSHSREKAKPYLYQTYLEGEKIGVELTCSKRVGMHRYKFPKSKDSKLIFNLSHSVAGDKIYDLYIKKVSDTELVGYRITGAWVDHQHIYFYAKFSKPFKKFELTSNKNVVLGDSLKSKDLKAIAFFDTDNNEKIELGVALSSVSIKNAKDNYLTEVGAKRFDEICSRAKYKWNEKLTTIKIRGGTKKQREIFYTSLYRSFLTPNIIHDNDGDYRGFNNEIHKTSSSVFSTFSLWDTYRAWNPMMTILNPEMCRDFIRSFVCFYKQTGELPIWPLASGETGTMIGYHSVSVIADAIMKGIYTENLTDILQAMVVSSNKERKGKEYYKEIGFIPSNYKRESVSCLLEYAYDDWCIAQVAKKIGNDSIYNEYIQRAQNFYNVFDSETKFFRGKRIDGNWVEGFNPYEISRDFTEASAWQYRFYVPHDINALINLMGGEKNFEQALDNLFSDSSKHEGDLVDVTGIIGQYAHGNEPSHHMGYLYNYVGKPWKTQRRIRQILETMYNNTPDGICGNEDCGQMSAWYILSSLGFYPVCPGSNQYIITAPIFPEVEIQLSKNKTLRLISENVSSRNMYIKRLYIDGKLINENFITHYQLVNAKEIRFVMSDQPNKLRGEKSKPYSLSENKKIVSIPSVNQDVDLFKDSVLISLSTPTKGAKIVYNLTDSDSIFENYYSPFWIKKSSVIKAKAIKKGYEDSKFMLLNARKLKYSKAIKRNFTENGVNYKYYENKFSSVNDIEKENYKRKGIVKNFDISLAVKQDYFAIIFNAFLKIDRKGVYKFFTQSDDGSCLYINNKEVVNNDGSHGEVKSTGKIALEKGFHKICVKYFEDYEGQSLKVGYSSDNFEEQEFENQKLFK
jgi:predicted alpha-1,2-mannosidase